MKKQTCNRKVNRKIAAFLMAVMITIGSVTPVQATSTDTSITSGCAALISKAKVDSTVEQVAGQVADQLIKQGVTSVQYAVIDNGEIVASGTKGVYSKFQKVKLTPNHLYGIGSTSKMFTTTAVMQLVEGGKINLDKPLTTYIKEFKMADKRYKEITPRMLLNHSSGLMGTTSKNVFLLNSVNTYAHDNLLKDLTTQRLKADPGEFSVYCNDGFTLAEILVERVSNQSFTKYIHENITKPLGMKNTKTPMDSFSRNLLAKTYIGTLSNETPVDTVNLIGTGGIYATAEDLCKFATIFMKDGAENVLSKESVTQMANEEYKNGIWPEDSEDNSLAYGLGWDSVNLYPFNRYGIKALTKGGDTSLYHNALVVLPDKNMAVAINSSGGSSAYSTLAGVNILTALLEEKQDLGTMEEEKISINRVQIPDSQKELAGNYAGSTLFKISFDDNNYMIIEYPLMPKQPPVKMIYTDQGYYIRDGEPQKGGIRLTKEKNGEVYMASFATGDIPGFAKSAASMFEGQRISDNNLSKKVQNAWKKREGKLYFSIDETYQSQLYIQGLPVVSLGSSPLMPGYVGAAKIIDEQNAKAYLKLPVTLGRDWSDYSFYVKDGKEYLKLSSNLFVGQEGVRPITKNDKYTCTIAKDGYSKWFSVGKNRNGKTMTVKIPKNGSYAVYHKDGSISNIPYVSGKASTKLVTGDYVVFSGAKGTKFQGSFR